MLTKTTLPGNDGMNPAEIQNLKQELRELHPEECQDTWQWKGLEQILEPVTPTKFLIDGLIPKGSITLFFGEDGSMKSLLAMDIAVCVATGKEFLVGLDDRTKSYATQRANVLWYDADNGDYLVHERLRAFIIGHNVRPDNLHYLSFPDELFIATENNKIAWMIGDIERFNAELLVIDNLSTISGEIDENGPQVQQIMTPLRSIVNKTGIAIILIHHATKGTGGYRGHGRIRQNCDLALKISKAGPDSDVVNVQGDKVRRMKPVKTFAGLFTYENDGDVMRIAKFFGTVPQLDDTQEPIKRNLAQDVIIELLSQGKQQNQTQIANHVDSLNIAKRKTTLAALEQLTLDGLITQTDGPKNSKLYELSHRDS